MKARMVDDILILQSLQASLAQGEYEESASGAAKLVHFNAKHRLLLK